MTWSCTMLPGRLGRSGACRVVCGALEAFPGREHRALHSQVRPGGEGRGRGAGIRIMVTIRTRDDDQTIMTTFEPATRMTFCRCSRRHGR
jgi:hypothetical protein